MLHLCEEVPPIEGPEVVDRSHQLVPDLRVGEVLDHTQVLVEFYGGVDFLVGVVALLEPGQVQDQVLRRREDEA